MNDDTHTTTNAADSPQPFVSDRLRKFMRMHLEPDSDPNEVTKRLSNTENPPDYATWLEADLRTALENQALTPEVMQETTFLSFSSQKDVDDFMYGLWEDWFPGKEYPTRSAS